MTFPVIAGHRQANHTECPGNIFYPLLPTVRLEAAGRPQAPIITLVRAGPVRFSPNGDGALDTTALSLWLTKKASWSVELRDAGGERLGSYSGEGDARRGEVAGHRCRRTHVRRRRVHGGRLRVLSARQGVPKTVEVAIDTVPPRLASADVRPAPSARTATAGAIRSRCATCPPSVRHARRDPRLPTARCGGSSPTGPAKVTAAHSADLGRQGVGPTASWRRPPKASTSSRSSAATLPAISRGRASRSPWTARWASLPPRRARSRRTATARTTRRRSASSSRGAPRSASPSRSTARPCAPSSSGRSAPDPTRSSGTARPGPECHWPAAARASR